MTDGVLEINTPRWAVPLHQKTMPDGSPVRYRGAYGGRGSGKSHEFAGMIVEEMIYNPDFSAVCIREIQKSLKNSAKKLIVAKIKEFGVTSLFEVLNAEIRRIGGSGMCIFQGMQDHTADSVKSLEGFDVAWIEEAQSLSQRSLDLLRPTIRKMGSEIWASWNPRRRGDPIEKLLRHNKRNDAIVVKTNYTDNPFLPETLLKEAQSDKELNPDGFGHTWLGEYENIGSKVVIPAAWVKAAIGLKEKLGLEATGRTYGALDVAGAEEGGDENSFAVRKGIEVFFIETWNGYDTAITTQRAVNLATTHGVEDMFYDSVGVGEGVTGEWSSMGRRDEQPYGLDVYPWNGGAGVLNPDERVDEEDEKSPLNKNQYANMKAQAWFALRRRFENAYKASIGKSYDPENLISISPDIDDLEQLEDELTQPQHKISGTGKTMVDKQPDGAKSPNRADSIVMAFWPVEQSGYTLDYIL